MEWKDLDNSGRLWIRAALSDGECDALADATSHHGAPGARIALSDSLSKLVGSDSVFGRLAEMYRSGARVVRIVAFDKTEKANWVVPWHQDRVIAVTARHEVPGYSNWTHKRDVWHVEPPVALLERMFFARVHLDDTDGSNGCMEIALGSHRHGVVPSHHAAELATAGPVEACVARRGDLVFVDALTLHRSGASMSPRPRRTLRIDFSADDLPYPLQWALRPDNDAV
ncbi:MAG: phytanoyl-CoA dioxygenase family protein [Hyphomicrobiaceae bacterium]